MARDKIYQQVANFLQKAIDSGELKAGEAIYSENLLCEKLGVSRTSVRKAIRLMVERNILVSRQGKGTFIKSNGSGVIYNALCLVNHYSRLLRYDVVDSYYSDIIYGAETCARDNGFDFSIFSREFHTFEEARKLFCKLKYDGLIIDGACQREAPYYLKNLYSNLAIVDGNPECGEIPVAAPDAESGFSALLELASRRSGPVFYLSHEHGENYRWRNISFQRAAEKAGIPYTYIDFGKNIHPDLFSHLGGGHYPLILQIIKEYAKPQNAGGTFIAGCDYIASKLIIALNHLGFSVPGDFAVSGFCGIGFSGLTVPALTTVKVDPLELVRNTVEMVIDQINGKKSGSDNRIVPVGVIKRESL